MLLWQGSIVEVDYGLFRVFGPYFIEKYLGSFKIWIFELWSFIWQPYPDDVHKKLQIYLTILKTPEKIKANLYNNYT